MVASVSHRLGKAECVCSAMPGLHFSLFPFPFAGVVALRVCFVFRPPKSANAASAPFARTESAGEK